MRWLVFLALSVIISYAANGAKPSNLSNNQTPLPTDCTQPSPNVTEVCDNALKKMETKLEKLIANKLETKLEKLLKQNLETKLEKLTATCEDALKIACVASVSSRGSSRKLGQEQKKKKNDGGRGGERRNLFSPPPPPSTFFWLPLLTFAQ